MSLGSSSQPVFLTMMQRLPKCSSPFTPGQRAASQGHEEEQGRVNIGNVCGLFISS